jgi:hypothetical protein
MAKAAQKSGDDESIMGYFRPILEQNHELLKGRSNDELYARWLKDHPGHKSVPDQVRNGLSNLKSTLRKKYGIRKGRRRKKAAAGAAAESAAPAVKRLARGAAGQMDRLEEQIDECLALAKTVDREGLGDVINLLRTARNRVVVQTAQ